MPTFPALALFRQIPVVPVTKVHQHVAFGGPIWPEFDTQKAVRHCRLNGAWDKEPPWPEHSALLRGPAVWGGFLDSHFGHFVADHLPRLPMSLRERPDDVYLFTVDPGMTRAGLGDWVWQVFDWIGLKADQVRLVTEPVMVDRLRVGVQAETLPQSGPKPAYLDLIDTWTARLTPQPAEVLYVSRVGVPQRGGGAHAGESYLVRVLQGLGVAVLDPARASIQAQLAAYAGAGRIVFAEGSALHGRQLLGRLPQDIAVLRRREERSMAKASLTPRCRTLSYHDINAGVLMAYWKTGGKRADPALSLVDVPRLWAVFQGFGMDMAAVWDEGAFRQAALRDVADWLDCHKPGPQRMAEYQAVLVAAGLT